MDESVKIQQKRRSRNEGSIRFIESRKLYEARYVIGIDENGKSIFKSIFGKKKGELMTRMRDSIATLGKGSYVDPSSKTLLSWCRDWYEVHKAPNIKVNTREKYSISIRRLEQSDIANMKLKDITQEIVQRYYNKLSKTYAVETVKATHSLINGALEKAEEIQLIARNTARAAKIPVAESGEKETKALTVDEYTRFIKALADTSHYYMFALFLSNTGLRPGEAIALSRKDVDLENATVRVNKTFIRVTGAVQNSTKTTSSNRTVPVPNDMIRLLKEYMMKQKCQDPTSPMFQNDEGGYLSSHNVTRQFKICGVKIGCVWLSLHTLRHTYASRLFCKKVDIKVISQLLGHKDVSTTYDIYVHFIDNIVADSVQILNAEIPAHLPQKCNLNKNSHPYQN